MLFSDPDNDLQLGKIINNLSDPKDSLSYSYIQTVPNHQRLLIIDDKSLPHKQRRAFTQLLIFKIKFSSEPHSR